MITRSKKGRRKTDCANCGHALEPELVGKQSYCRACKADYMVDWRAKRKSEIERAMEFYKLHNG